MASAIANAGGPGHRRGSSNAKYLPKQKGGCTEERKQHIFVSAILLLHNEGLESLKMRLNICTKGDTRRLNMSS